MFSLIDWEKQKKNTLTKKLGKTDLKKKQRLTSLDCDRSLKFNFSIFISRAFVCYYFNHFRNVSIKYTAFDEKSSSCEMKAVFVVILLLTSVEQTVLTKLCSGKWLLFVVVIFRQYFLIYGVDWLISDRRWVLLLLCSSLFKQRFSL